MLKSGGQLGLSIVGGVDHTSHPFGATEPGVYISKVCPVFAVCCSSKYDYVLLLTTVDMCSNTSLNHVKYNDVIVGWDFASNPSNFVDFA